VETNAVHEALFDLRTDPGETRNLVAEAEAAAGLSEARERLHAHHAASGVDIAQTQAYRQRWFS
jgi:hypothetical protein